MGKKKVYCGAISSTDTRTPSLPTFGRSVQFLGVFFAGGVRVVSSHGDQAVCVHEAHSAHVQSGHQEVDSQLTHVTNGNRRLEGDKRHSQGCSAVITYVCIYI